MKKLFTFICVFALVICSSLSFVGCKKETKAGTIRLNEVTHSVFYAPLYVAINKGYMEEEGITIELTNGGGSDASMTALLSGSADMALMGPETVVYVEANGSTNHPVVFGQLTKKDGSFLISKTPISSFSFESSLLGKTAIIGRQGGMPAMTFEWLCNKSGVINGTNVTLDKDTSFNMMVSVFESTNAEFCTMFEPTASAFVSAGKGYYVGSVGEYSGEIPYTCFMAYPDYISKNKAQVEGFLRAIKKAYIFITTSSSSDVAEALVPSFDGTTKEELMAAVEKYLEIDAWSNSPAMSKDSYARLLSVLKNAGTLEEDVDFSKIVDNSIANTI
ncbi:MAG: ABC transporter substrate-binding protein [Clostridiales bacterium]|nr:ABC transporter substrate-binding protein [Clostridiales bacterium]